MDQKRAPPAWLWALVAVVLVLAAWAIVLTEDPPDGGTRAAVEMTQRGAAQ
jgi:hypothetical protein